MSLVYDAGALIAAERDAPKVRELHTATLRAGVVPMVPVVVLAQAWRGGPQPRLSRLLHGCQILPDTEPSGRLAGAICARSGTTDVADALVVATALLVGGAIVTSDPGDLTRLVECVDASIPLVSL